MFVCRCYDLDSEPHLDHSQEYAIIKNRCKRPQAQRNQAAAGEQNKQLDFLCTVCLEKCPIADLRIATPCGHGFCEGCIDFIFEPNEHSAADDPASPCFACRATVAAVVQQRYCTEVPGSE